MNPWIYLFLDFDGVILPVTDEDLPMLDPGPHRNWSLVQPLARALAPYREIQLVVSSTWRHMYEIEDLQRFLAPLRLAAITGRSEGSRYEEIRAYMYKRPEQWLALDDDDDDWAEEERWRLIKCDERVGVGDPARLKELVVKIEALRNSRSTT